MTPQEIEDLKTVEYYSAAVTAWFNTALEHDKSILTLAAGGIGLLITLLTTVGLSTAEALVTTHHGCINASYFISCSSEQWEVIG